jgi:hypothetical protein
MSFGDVSHKRRPLDRHRNPRQAPRRVAIPALPEPTLEDAFIALVQHTTLT